MRQTKVSTVSGVSTTVFPAAQASEDLFPCQAIWVVADAELSHAANL